MWPPFMSVEVVMPGFLFSYYLGLMNVFPALAHYPFYAFA
jgi:hypothetical protein